ncbi:MAG: MerR family transcriptional regulator [Nitrospiria bacterium]
MSHTKQYPPKEICKLLALSYRQLEYWVLIGVVKPTLEPHGKKQYQKFSQDDLCFLREVKTLTDEGYLVSRAAEKVRRLMRKNHSRRDQTATLT